MHSDADLSLLLDVARDARLVVEIGVYEGASAIALCQTLPADAELHLVDPFGRHPDALPSGWGAVEWATRRVVARALRARGHGAGRARGYGGSHASRARGTGAGGAPTVCWHTCLSADLARDWRGGEVDLVFIDGDHSEAGCELDWAGWQRFVPVGGHVVFHDARLHRPGGRGLPGPTAVVDRHFRGSGGEDGGKAGIGGGAAAARRPADWEIVAEADRTVVVRRLNQIGQEPV